MPVPPTDPYEGLDLELLGRRIAEKRDREGLSLREAADQCGGISFSTLGRLERCEVPHPDLPSLARVLAWLGLTPSSLFAGAQPIRAHLRAQKRLDSSAAQAIASVVRTAQTRFSSEDPAGAAEAARHAGESYQRLRGSLRERFAVQFRNAIGVPVEQPLDPFSLQIQGITVMSLTDVPELDRTALSTLTDRSRHAWSAMTLPLDLAESAWLIIMNPMHTLERRRATLMEEICHILLGHHLTSFSHVEGQTFRDYNDDQEADAFGLGAAILVPRRPLLARVAQGQAAKTIGEHFGVSEELVQYRIKITGAWYSYKLLQHVSKEGPPRA
jgi:transcriptional regulator with XRE-family HTH domain